MPFKRPSTKETVAALGKLDGKKGASVAQDASPSWLRCLDVTSATTRELFPPIPRVRRGEWLSEHHERGQSFASFQRRSFAVKPHAYFTTLYMVPFGDFPPAHAPSLTHLADFAAAFFGFPVRVTKRVPLRKVSDGRRVGMEGQDQLLIEDLYTHLRGRKNPRDCFASIGVTMTDLYPGEEWNFVFGQANLTDGIGAYSFARFGGGDGVFMGEGRAEPLPISEEERRLLLRRSCKVLCHETGHMLGLKVRGGVCYVWLYVCGWVSGSRASE